MYTEQYETEVPIVEMTRFTFRANPSETKLGVEVIPSDRSTICQNRVMLMGFLEVSVSNQDSDRF